jgi:hypothetical protein
MGIPMPTNDSAQTRIKLNGRFRNIDGEATNKQVSLDMTDTPFTKYKFQTTLYLIGSNQTTSGRKRATFLLQQQMVKKICFKKKSRRNQKPKKHNESTNTGPPTRHSRQCKDSAVLAAACPAQASETQIPPDSGNPFTKSLQMIISNGFRSLSV